MGRAFLLSSRLLPAAACTRDHLARCERASNAGVAYFVPAHPLHLRLPCNLPCSGRMHHLVPMQRCCWAVLPSLCTAVFVVASGRPGVQVSRGSITAASHVAVPILPLP